MSATSCQPTDFNMKWPFMIANQLMYTLFDDKSVLCACVRLCRSECCFSCHPPPPRRAKRPLSTALTNAPYHDWTFSWFLWPIPSTRVTPIPSQANTALSPVLARTMCLSLVSGAVRSQSRQKCPATVQTLGLLEGLDGPRSSNFAAPNLEQAYSCQPPHLHSMSVLARGYDLEQGKVAQ